LQKFAKAVLGGDVPTANDIIASAIEHKCIVIVEIYPGPNRPYYIKSLGKEEGTYIRVAGTTRKADPVRIKELEMQGTRLSYDEMVCVGHEVTDEAVKKLCADIRKFMLAHADSDEAKKTVNDVTQTNLENWGIVKRQAGAVMATNAFVLLTSDKFRFARIQCARFKGTERVVFIDKREFAGPLYEQIEEAYQFVLKHINLGAEINGLIRKDVYELPVGSIRESIVNSVTHRNYMENSSIQVAVYDDRVEVTSPGMLYGDLDIDSIKKGKSKIRNKGIAEVFNRMKIIEEWGTGINRIISGCKEYDLREPEFMEIGDSFRVNIFRKQEGVQNKQLASSQESSQESNQESSQEILNKTQVSILDLIRENNAITQEEISHRIGVSFGAIKKNIALLKGKGILVRTGPTKKGSWEIQRQTGQSV